MFCLEHDIIDHNIVMQLARFVFGVFDEMIITCMYFFCQYKASQPTVACTFSFGYRDDESRAALITG